MTPTCPTCGRWVASIETEAFIEPSIGSDGLLTEAGMSPFVRSIPGRTTLRPCGHQFGRDETK